MRTALGQPIVIENVTGAGGTLGVGRVAHAAPDGYTVGIGAWNTHVVNGAIYPLTYDVFADFEPVALIANNTQLIVSKNDVPARDLKELIAKLNAAAVDALSDSAVRQRLADLGQDIPARERQTPQALASFHRAEIDKWWPILKAANIKID